MGKLTVGDLQATVPDAAYARALWRVLALVLVPGSIHYIVLPRARLRHHSRHRICRAS